MANEVTITLYQMLKDPALCGKIKSTDTINHTSVKGTFRGAVDLVSPRLELQKGTSGVDESASTSGWTSLDINKYNYFKIEELNRYYYITGCTISPMGIMLMSGIEDYLETYKTSIQAMNCFVERCEASSYINSHLPDTIIWSEPQNLITTRTTSILRELNYTNSDGDIIDASFFADTSDACSVSGFYQQLEKLLTNTNNNDDTKLCYIITLCQGSIVYSDNSGTLVSQLRVPNVDTMESKILCTRKWLNKFLTAVNSIGTSILDHFTDFKTGIRSIECFPDYIPVANIPSGLEALQGFRVGGIGTVDVIDRYLDTDPASTPEAHAYPICQSLKKIETHFSVVPYPQASGESATAYAERLLNYQKSNGYTTYKLKYEPFGEMEIPANDIVGHEKIYFKIVHSLMDGDAKLFYSVTGDTFNQTGLYQLATQRTAKATDWQKLAETTFSYPVSFTKTNGVGELIVAGIKTAVQVAGTIAVAEIQSAQAMASAEALKEKTKSDLMAQYEANAEMVGRKASLDVASSFDNSYNLSTTSHREFAMEMASNEAKENYKYLHEPELNKQLTYIGNPQTSTASAIHGQAVLGAMNTLLGVRNDTEIVGQTQTCLMDAFPILFIISKTYVTPTAHYVGRPSYMNVTLSNLAINNTIGGYAKIMFYNFASFGSSTEPTPIPFELEQIGNALTSGIYLRTL